MAQVERWSVGAVACNNAQPQGVDDAFDAAYEFGASVGDEGGMVGTAEEIGAEVTRFLKTLSKADVEAMLYGGTRFWIRLVVEPVSQTGIEGE